MRRESLERLPALAASAALHVALFVAALIIGSLLTRPIQGSGVVPVTLMTAAQADNASPAIQAPTPAPATTEQPAPEAPPQATPPTPAPEPKPAPPPPKPAAVKTPKPALIPPKQPQPAQEKPDTFFSDLSKDLSHGAKAPPQRRASGQVGPAHPQTAVQARLSTGRATAASAAGLESLGEQLGHNYHPDCDFRNGPDVNIEVKLKLGPAGRLVGEPTSDQSEDHDTLIKAAAARAIRAVYQGQPFGNLPPELYGPTITINFNPKLACAGR